MLSDIGTQEKKTLVKIGNLERQGSLHVFLLTSFEIRH